MQKYLSAYFPNLQGGVEFLSLFGYASNSIPGIEVIGMGKHGRALKEKLVFFTKRLNIKLPLKKYTLCVDDVGGSCGDFSYLEFPFFLLLLNLAEVVEIGLLESCVCSGKLMLNGSVYLPSLEGLPIGEQALEGTLLIGQRSDKLHPRQKYIVVEELFNQGEVPLIVKCKSDLL